MATTNCVLLYSLNSVQLHLFNKTLALTKMFPHPTCFSLMLIYSRTRTKAGRLLYLGPVFSHPIFADNTNDLGNTSVNILYCSSESVSAETLVHHPNAVMRYQVSVFRKAPSIFLWEKHFLWTEGHRVIKWFVEAFFSTHFSPIFLFFLFFIFLNASFWQL